jgi:hypothetical protein
MHIHLIKDWPRPLGVVVIALSIVCGIVAEEHPQLWSKSIQGERGTPKNERRYFELGEVSQEKTRLVGNFHLDEHVIPGQKNGAFIIDGSQSDDGRFWPNVELQVSNETNGKWQTIASSLDHPVSARVQVYPGLSVFGLSIDFDPFKRFIGKYNFGRVSLKSGEKAVFPLDDLKP